ncbi:alpha-hydroxy-acid oxidizing protein [Pseudomonas aeruginosa]|nr:alpha-hydroxy-acid oxidizing protein [Pseudomonas aeruginosa]
MESRRNFLKTSAMLGAGASLLSLSAFAAPARAASATHSASSAATSGSKAMQIINFTLLEEQARKKLSPAAYTFIARGAGDEWTLKENTRVFLDHPLQPHQLSGVLEKDIDLGLELLGVKLPFPILTAPMGIHGFFHPSAEAGSAGGAGQLGALYTASGASNLSLEEIAKASQGGPQWFQLYFNRDLGVTSELLKRAKAAGYKAIVLTVDAMGPGSSDAWLEMGKPFPKSMLFGNHDPKRGGRGNFANQKSELTLKDVEWVRSESGLPVVVKGLLNPGDARDAVSAGAAAIQVSNHGARQFDGLPASLSALPGVVRALDGKTPVIFDSGIRRGADVLRALALGADAVALGRPLLYGLAVGGAKGVRLALEHVRDELRLAMLFAGVSRLADIGPDNLFDRELRASVRN